MTSQEETVAVVYCDTLDDALKEVAKRRAGKAKGVITRFEPSTYGGYRVHSIAADILVDDLTDPVRPNVLLGPAGAYK